MKEKKENKQNKPKKENKQKNHNNDANKEKITTRFINTIKKRWLISGTNTVLLIAILIAVVILINSIISSLELTPIDCTSNKEYTLTEESKNRVKNIEANINMYFVGFSDEDSTLILAKQYNKVNDKINVEVIDANERTDIAEKYDVSNESSAIIVENEEKNKIIYSSDLYTYDSNYNTVDVTEEKLTSAILNVTSDKIPNVYFLTSYSAYNLEDDGGLRCLSLYLDDEVLNYSTLDLLVKGSIPEDCDTLVIVTPTKDFDNLTTDEIIKYINKGGNILWLNSSYAEKQDLPNVNKILALYGIDPFDEGYIYETDVDKTVLGYASCIQQDLGNSQIDKDLNKAILLNPTKINVNDEKIEELDIEKETIISSTDTSYYRKNVSNTSTNTDGDEQGGFEIASIFTKPIKDENEEENEEENTQSDEEEITSQLILFGDNNFVSDIQLASNINPMLILENNVDLALNSIAYLTDQEDGITVRKEHSSGVQFTATDGQKSTILKIIFTVPVAIIIIGIIVWQIRRRKKIK